jgi:hypothetical protein
MSVNLVFGCMVMTRWYKTNSENLRLLHAYKLSGTTFIVVVTSYLVQPLRYIVGVIEYRWLGIDSE